MLSLSESASEHVDKVPVLILMNLIKHQTGRAAAVLSLRVGSVVLDVAVGLEVHNHLLGFVEEPLGLGPGQLQHLVDVIEGSHGLFLAVGDDVDVVTPDSVVVRSQVPGQARDKLILAVATPHQDEKLREYQRTVFMVGVNKGNDKELPRHQLNLEILLDKFN